MLPATLRRGIRIFLSGALLGSLVLQLGYSRPGHAQTFGSTPIISAPVVPLKVKVDLKLFEALEPGPGPVVTVPEGEPLPDVPPPPRMRVLDPVAQIEADAPLDGRRVRRLTPPLVNVPGITSGSNPPDTVGDIGANHFVQMVNVTRFQIWDKEGNVLIGPITFGNLWPVGERCRNNAGDPIVVYDHLADRWVLTQFASPNHMCFAISLTPDPTEGSWFLYTFDVGRFPDYPKFGVWPDGYYMSSYEPPTLGVYVFDRASMLVGDPSFLVKTTIPAFGAPGVRDTRILPSDLDGPPPPEGTPNYFLRTVDDQQHPANPADRIEIFEFTADWANLFFDFVLVETLAPSPFNMMLCNRNGSGVRDCVPQPQTNSTIDALSNRPMMQLKYRNFGDYAAMVVNQTIDVSANMPVPADHEVAGIRWYELRKFEGIWTIYQEGTYARQPRDASVEQQLLHRFMGSAAMDRRGNIALGYSVANDDDDNPVFPGIRYVGRRFDDRPGVMPSAERTILDGINSQIGTFGLRWGDYSALSVDPVDDCTFWYTTHVAGLGGSGPRPTQIASFRFFNCAPGR